MCIRNIRLLNKPATMMMKILKSRESMLIGDKNRHIEGNTKKQKYKKIRGVKFILDLFFYILVNKKRQLERAVLIQLYSKRKPCVFSLSPLQHLAIHVLEIFVTLDASAIDSYFAMNFLFKSNCITSFFLLSGLTTKSCS